MKKIIPIILIVIILVVCSNCSFKQENNWQKISEGDITSIEISETGKYKVHNYTLDVIWDNKLSHSENIGYYGGIKKLSINKENNYIQALSNIEDGIALGSIYFDFFDYNFDGYIDFSFPISCGKICWNQYYIFNPQSNKFEHKEDWDYLRIKAIDKKNKMILSESNGNAVENNQKIYKVKGLDIIEIKQ